MTRGFVYASIKIPDHLYWFLLIKHMILSDIYSKMEKHKFVHGLHILQTLSVFIKKNKKPKLLVYYILASDHGS